MWGDKLQKGRGGLSFIKGAMGREKRDNQ